MPHELFEFFVADDPDAALRFFVGVIGVHVVNRRVCRADHDRRRIHALAGEFRAVELILDVRPDRLRLLLVGENVRDELAVQIEKPERKEGHVFLAAFGEVAHLDALAAQIDEHGALVGGIVDVGNVVAVRLGGGVDEVDGEARLRLHARAHFVEILYVSERGGRDEIAPFRAEIFAGILHFAQAVNKFFDAALREFAPVEIVHEADREPLLEEDLRFALIRRRHDEGQTARTDVNDRIFHKKLLKMLIFTRGRRKKYRSRGQSAPCRPRGLRICICPRRRQGR